MAPLFTARGKCSYFGGPNDTGVAPDEGLAFIYEYDQRPDLFLVSQPPNTSGLARRLNPDKPYIACRWDYNVTPGDMLRDILSVALVTAPETGKSVQCWPADWGPNQNTGRIADLSPGALAILDLETDDTVEVIYPYEAEVASNTVDLTIQQTTGVRVTVVVKEKDRPGEGAA